MGPFPNTHENKFIVVVMDYASKWVEAQAHPSRDARTVERFLKKPFSRFGTREQSSVIEGPTFATPSSLKF